MSDLFWEYTNDEIEKFIEKQVTDLGDKLDHIEITWAETETEFHLWLRPIPAAGVFPRMGDGLDWAVTTLAAISKNENGDYSPENFAKVREAGRKLYYQLRKKYPIKRDLSVER